MLLRENLSIGTMPKPCHIETPFGWYSLAITPGRGELLIEQKLCIRTGVHPRTLFDQYRIFINQCAEAFGVNIVLKKQ